MTAPHTLQPRRVAQRRAQIAYKIKSFLVKALDLLESSREGKKIQVTLTYVDLSPDLRHVNVFILPFAGQGDLNEALEVLRQHAHEWECSLFKSLNLKFKVRLRFSRDTVFEEAERVAGVIARVASQEESDET